MLINKAKSFVYNQNINNKFIFTKRYKRDSIYELLKASKLHVDWSQFIISDFDS